MLLLLVIAAGAAAWTLSTTRWAECKGYVMTDSEVEIRPSVEGAIDKWLVTDGSSIKEDDLIMQLKCSVQQAAYEQAIEQLAAAAAQLEHIHATNKLDKSRRKEQAHRAQKKLELTTDRLRRLKGASASVSQREIREATLEVDVAKSWLAELKLPRDEMISTRIAVVRDNIEAAKKEVALRKAELEMRQVRAAISGNIYFNRFEEGEVVKPDHVLGQIFNSDTWIVKLTIDERHLPHVKAGQTVIIELAALPAWRHGTINAKVSRVIPIVTPQATGDGIFYIEATIESSPVKLSPGMQATATIDTGSTNWLMRMAGL